MLALLSVALVGGCSRSPQPSTSAAPASAIQITVNSGGPVVQLSRTNKLRIIGIATQYVPVPEDVLPLKPPDATDPAPSPARTMLALGNSGYGVVASADSIIDLIAGF
jgi:hypothetical protein